MMKSTRLASITMLLLWGCGSSEARPAPAPREPVAVQVAEARVGPVDVEYVATATVRGQNTAVLTSKVMGYVRALHVRPGDRVRAGQVLVELDAQDARAHLAQARAGIGEADAALAQAESDVAAATSARRIAELTWQRTQRLHEQGAATAHELDQADTTHESARARERLAEARLRAARARIGQARAGAQVASALLDHRRVVAPFEGQVIARTVDVGDLASPGTPLLTVEEQGALRAEAVVDESQASRIALGDGASVEVEAAGVVLEGTVSEIVPAVDVTSRAFTVKLDLPADEASAALRHGMFGRVRFRVSTAERLLVPEAALCPRGQLDRVFVAEEGRARVRLVSLGQVHEGGVEVLAGLSPGEEVVIDAPAGLPDAAPIEVRR